MIEEIRERLRTEDISFSDKEGGIAKCFPFEFGELEFHELPGDDDILFLADEDWQTHSSVMDGAEGIGRFTKDVLDNKYLLIKEVSPEGVPTKRIEEDLDEYHRWLPEGHTYEICNKA